MSTYRHYLSGFFEHRDQAELALNQLHSQGIPPLRIQLFDANSTPLAHKSTDSSNEVLKEVLVDGAVGTVVGITIGALGQVALVAANVTLFVASPLIAPLIMMGWGAGIGGLLGASAGAAAHSKSLSDLVSDAIAQGQIVVVVETLTEQETQAAKETFKMLIGDYQDRALAQ